MKCTYKPCPRYYDNEQLKDKCCRECLDDDCEFLCGHLKDEPCKYIREGE